MKFKCGIIGLPNVGKSTLFNILTDSSVKAENFPFCTIKANKGYLSIIDDRLFQLSKLLKITRIVYGNIELIDIAGLIEGASGGAGLGNSFLNDISEVDILCHVVRCFHSPDIFHVNYEINPEKDIKIIHNELILSDIELCERTIYLLKKNSHSNNNLKVLGILKKCLIYLNNGIMLRSRIFNLEEINIIRCYKFLTYKPIIYIANTNFSDHDVKNDYLLKLSDIAISENIPYLSICFLFQKKFQEDKNFKKCSKFLNLIKMIYKSLQLKTFFTTNMKEVKAYIISKHAIAVQAANMIHTDFEKYFIRVQVLSYDDFILFRSWKNAKKFGKVRSESKNYLIQDGDILNFLI